MSIRGNSFNRNFTLMKLIRIDDENVTFRQRVRFSVDFNKQCSAENLMNFNLIVHMRLKNHTHRIVSFHFIPVRFRDLRISESRKP